MKTGCEGNKTVSYLVSATLLVLPLPPSERKGTTVRTIAVGRITLTNTSVRARQGYCASREEMLSQGICSVDARGEKKNNTKNTVETKKYNVKIKKTNTKTKKFI